MAAHPAPTALSTPNGSPRLSPVAPGAIRIITWNCNMAFQRKADRLLALQPDIAVVQECADTADLTGYRRVGWSGRWATKGLGVFAKPELRAAVVDALADPSREFFLPVRVPGLDLDLLACWAMNHNGIEDRPKRGRTLSALAHYEPLLSTGRAIVTGDLNNNVFWDTPRYPAFAEITDALARHDLVNLHYARTGEVPGKEWSATLFFLRNAARRYLIDHVFLPAAWLPRVAAYAIGASTDWLDVSDHMPVVVDIAVPGGGATA